LAFTQFTQLVPEFGYVETPMGQQVRKALDLTAQTVPG
jgi:hypothetical protein